MNREFQVNGVTYNNPFYGKTGREIRLMTQGRECDRHGVLLSAKQTFKVK